MAVIAGLLVVIIGEKLNLNIVLQTNGAQLAVARLRVEM